MAENPNFKKFTDALSAKIIKEVAPEPEPKRAEVEAEEAEEKGEKKKTKAEKKRAKKEKKLEKWRARLASWNDEAEQMIRKGRDQGKEEAEVKESEEWKKLFEKRREAFDKVSKFKSRLEEEPPAEAAESEEDGDEEVDWTEEDASALEGVMEQLQDMNRQAISMQEGNPDYLNDPRWQELNEERTAMADQVLALRDKQLLAAGAEDTTVEEGEGENEEGEDDVRKIEERLKELREEIHQVVDEIDKTPVKKLASTGLSDKHQQLLQEQRALIQDLAK
jgi:hypothetical protein